LARALARRNSLNTDILQPITDDSSLQAERRFLRALWLDPARGTELAEQLGLSGRDFLGDGHSLVFCYVCTCAHLERTPCMAEAAALSPPVCGELTYAVLDEIHFFTETRADALLGYGRELQRIADDRATAELREVCRETLRAIHRGLRFEAELSRRRHNRKVKPPERRRLRADSARRPEYV